MQKVSDSVTSIFQLETKEERLAKCLQGGSTIVYSEKFGLGWRFGLQYSQERWSFAKVKVYLDHTHCSPSATDAATVTVCLKDGCTPEVPSFDSRSVSIADFGHGPPSLIGSFSPSVIAAHPCMWFTVTTKANFAPVIADPLINTASALRQSMNNGEFTDIKYYAMSKRRTRRFLGETRAVYANSAILDHGAGVAPVLPSSISEDSLLVHYLSEQRLMMDAEQSFDFDLSDSDIDSEEEVEEKTKKTNAKEVPSKPPPYRRSYSVVAEPSEFDASSDITSESSALSSDDDNDNWTEWTTRRHPGFRSTDTLRAEPQPRPFSPIQQLVLVRNTAFATWASYVYYCYTGQVTFYPLKSKDPLGRRNNTTQTLRCSPRSMYRLALKFKNARLEALAFRAIKSNLSQKNILDEAFSQFTAQYPDIQKMELELLMEFRSAPEVAKRLEQVSESVSRGERPYAHAMLHGFLINLTGQRAGGTK
ncbi:uncharacterized protein F5891DRAFT_1197720 [Suillus fuscotomentosus]|uniref:Uncharacterized protein n=1 Tax=Suillus fuscotomentosus TaxID=1912939 RepID=A0AAD4DSN5_9AGAM|nr:uncharacterized protein F5891DRAFT_1197720 [Suillus fuscotomentosus]KAG1891544.1 hypothetical protein F5891DRAFT_1197720 [Suillus fuscotomentosus]